MHSRRSFMTSSLAAVAASASPLAGAAAPQAADQNTPAEPMRLSVLAYSFHGLIAQGQMDVFGFMEACQYRYGLRAADLWSGILTSIDEAYLKKIREALDGREMVVPNLACDLGTVWMDNPDQRKANVETAMKCLNAGWILGARYVRVDAGGGPSRSSGPGRGAPAAPPAAAPGRPAETRPGGGIGSGPLQKQTWTDEQFDYIVKQYRVYAQYAYDHGFKAGPRAITVRKRTGTR